MSIMLCFHVYLYSIRPIKQVDSQQNISTLIFVYKYYLLVLKEISGHIHNECIRFPYKLMKDKI